MKYKQLQTNMSARYLPLMLSLLLLLCSCHESGHDPGKELYEQQLQQKGLLAHRIDSLFSSAFTDPLGVERGLEELYLHRGVSAGTLSSDPFLLQPGHLRPQGPQLQLTRALFASPLGK